MSRRITSTFAQAKPAVHATKNAAAALPRGLAAQESFAPSSPVQTEEHDEQALRQFDLNSKYGPVSGMTRLQRWERAVKLGLGPPTAVQETIMRYGEDSSLNRHLFSEGKV